MRKAFKHTGVLLMTAVLGLSVIGAAYALWFEDLRLDANVKTGTFDVDWSEHGVQPVVSTDLGKTWLVGDQIPAGKAPLCFAGQIGDLQAKPPNNPLSNDVADDNTLLLGAGNVYPYSGCVWTINIHNQGTTPAHVQVLKVEKDCSPQANPPAGAPSPNNQPANCTTTGWPVNLVVLGGSWEGTTPASCDTAPPGATCPSDLTAIAACEALFGTEQAPVAPSGTIEGIQLHTSNELWCRLAVTLDQSALAEADVFQYAITMRWHQWNENQPAP